MSQMAGHAGRRGGPVRARSATVAITTIMVVIAGGLALAGAAGAEEPPVLDDAQLFVEPGTDLVDRQLVTVRGVDFDPASTTFGAAQCDATLVEQLEIDGCDLATAATGSTDVDGTVELDLRVRRIITTPGGGEIDCAVEDACVIGGGTLDDTLTGVIEGAATPISFDPEVPPTPPLSLDITIDDVTADAAAGTVTCNREATLFGVNVQLVQTKGPNTAEASGFLFDSTTCDVTPTAWAVELTPTSGFGFTADFRRFTGGPATATVSAFASDGVEGVEATQSTGVQLTGGPRDMTLVPGVDGEFTSITIIGSAADGGVEVEVVCDRPFESASVNVSVSQWAGLDLITGFGFVELDGCDGTERVVVPVESFLGGVLVGGPANVVASVFAGTVTPPDTFIFDDASTSGVIRRSGRTEPLLITPVPNPDSRITIDEVTRSSVSGTIDCEEPVQVFVNGFALKTHGRTTSGASAFDDIDCDGPTPFVLDLTQSGEALRGGGDAAVAVFATAFGIGPDGFPTILWDDNQQATVKLRG